MANDGPLYKKYEVSRMDGTDGPGGKHDGCSYFVLDLSHDPYACTAALAYAAACSETHPALAEDLRKLADPREAALRREFYERGYAPSGRLRSTT